jgi:hypothetical protein
MVSVFQGLVARRCNLRFLIDIDVVLDVGHACVSSCHQRADILLFAVY